MRSEKEIRAELSEARAMRDDAWNRIRHGGSALVAHNQRDLAMERIAVFGWVLGETEKKPWRDDDD